MTCNNIFKKALRLLNEKGNEAENEDYAERAPFIIASMCSEAEETDRRYRTAKGLSPAASFNHVYIDLEEDFPLADRFASPAAFYLASMLILDENDGMADKMYHGYCDCMARIETGIPAVIERTSEVY